MLTIKDLTGKEEALTDYKDITRKRRVNGEHSLSFLLLKTDRNAHSFDMVEDETTVDYDGDQYRIKHIEERLVGTTPVKQVYADHVFFDIIDVHQYGTLPDGETTITSALQHALANTGYTFSVIDSFAAKYFEGFGDANALALLKTILERYQAEYKIVGTDVRIYTQVGETSDFQFRYKHNVKTFAKTVRTDGLSTYIKGFGKQNDDGTYVATAEYTSPMADVYGIRHARPVRDESFTDSSALLDHIKAQIQDTPEVSITVDFADMRKAGYPYEVPGHGDAVFLIYEPLGVDMTTRILEITDFPESDKSPQVTLANFREQFTDVVFRHTKNELGKIYDPNTGKVKYNVLDEAVRLATESLQSAQTELEFVNGITGRDKVNPNLLTRFTSRGIGVSSDGGNTFPEAITGNGINTSLLTAGEINANNINVRGGTETSYALIDSLGFTTKGGAFRSERPDGYVSINNGIIQSDFAVQGGTPPYIDNGVELWGRYYRTQSTTPLNLDYLVFRHDARYLNIILGVHTDTSGVNAGIRVYSTGGGPTGGDLLASYNTVSTDPETNQVTITIDFGTPTGNKTGVYIRLVSGTSTAWAHARIISKYKEG